MYTTIRHELRHARKVWSGTLLDPCLLSVCDFYYFKCHENVSLKAEGGGGGVGEELGSLLLFYPLWCALSVYDAASVCVSKNALRVVCRDLLFRG
jgi:hypothetical protein